MKATSTLIRMTSLWWNIESEKIDVNSNESEKIDVNYNESEKQVIN